MLYLISISGMLLVLWEFLKRAPKHGALELGLLGIALVFFVGFAIYGSNGY